jgi:hypothetical protein
VKAYGWACITQLAANTPDLAIKNAGMNYFQQIKMGEQRKMC